MNKLPGLVSEDPRPEWAVKARTMPAQKPGLSKQDYGTPRVFLDAFEKRFGSIAYDLAAHAGNAVVPRFFSPEDDSLVQNWRYLLTEEGANLWLNPPFGHIEPWAEKCAAVAKAYHGTAYLALLVPASIGSNWFAEHVHRKAMVYALQGRLSFDGKNPYPKDCILAMFGLTPGFAVWDWRNPPR